MINDHWSCIVVKKYGLTFRDYGCLLYPCHPLLFVRNLSLLVPRSFSLVIDPSILIADLETIRLLPFILHSSYIVPVIELSSLYILGKTSLSLYLNFILHLNYRLYSTLHTSEIRHYKNIHHTPSLRSAMLVVTCGCSRHRPTDPLQQFVTYSSDVILFQMFDTTYYTAIGHQNIQHYTHKL